EALGKRAERLALPGRETALPEHVRVRRKELGRRWDPPSEVVLDPGEDRPRRLDRQLLADHLEDERAERVHRRELVEPRPWAEVGPRVDQSRENGIRLPEELPSLRIRECGHRA